MRLSKEQHKKVIEIVRSKIGTRYCPFCQESVSLNEFSVYDSIVYVGGLEEFVPLVLTNCNGCAYVMHLSAYQLGIVDPETLKLSI
jgi:hypothetical protein